MSQSEYFMTGDFNLDDLKKIAINDPYHNLLKILNYTINHLEDADDDLILDTIPVINHFCGLLKDHSNAGTLLISE